MTLQGKNTKVLMTALIIAVGVYFIISNFFLFAIIATIAVVGAVGYLLYKKIKNDGIGIFRR